MTEPCDISLCYNLLYSLKDTQRLGKGVGHSNASMHLLYTHTLLTNEIQWHLNKNHTKPNETKYNQLNPLKKKTHTVKPYRIPLL